MLASIFRGSKYAKLKQLSLQPPNVLVHNVKTHKTTNPNNFNELMLHIHQNINTHYLRKLIPLLTYSSIS